MRSLFIAPYRKWWRSFLRKNKTHPKVERVARSIDRTLMAAQGTLAGATHKVRRPADARRLQGEVRSHLKRLYASDLRGVEAIERVGALFVLSRRDPNYLPGDERLTYAIGRAVLLARPLHQIYYTDRKGRRRQRCKPLHGSAVRELGEHFRAALLSLVADVIHARSKS